MLDWTISVSILSLIGVVANVYKKKWCFILWIVTNAFWCVWDFKEGILSQAILFFVYWLLAIWGLYKWAKESKDGKTGNNTGN